MTFLLSKPNAKKYLHPLKGIVRDLEALISSSGPMVRPKFDE